MRHIVWLAAALALAAPALAEGDAEKGKAAFAKCAACHQLGPDAKMSIGPTLNGVVGRKPGTLEGYNFSGAMVAYGEANGEWTEALLDAYLEKPAAAVKGGKMAFAGIRKPEERANVIAYLKANP